MTNYQLRKLEVAKRRALWALAELKPGDPGAVKVLVELDEIDQALGGLVTGRELSSQEPMAAITTQYNNGICLVVDDSIPEPWRQRFWAASVGSTRLAAGAYFLDFKEFVLAWHRELEHLKAHRSSRHDRCSR
ncbi:hypothetical protein ACIKP7_09000 [Pseudomonas caricapapayae]|uniref:Uncharacterized protein n=1 Tax=Pseudomonas caricapapayae TaxID=46678 RepID=A0ACC7LUK8_9PSED